MSWLFWCGMGTCRAVFDNPSDRAAHIAALHGGWPATPDIAQMNAMLEADDELQPMGTFLIEGTRTSWLARIADLMAGVEWQHAEASLDNYLAWCNRFGITP